MMNINVEFFTRCIQTLDGAYQKLLQQDVRDISYDIYRAACIKEFEIILEQSGKLLKKRLVVYFASNKAVDVLTFKDLFRHAVKHGLIDDAACERWLLYRDNRNTTAHDYGVQFAESTVKILPEFIQDAQFLAGMIGGNVDV
jgi:nucleotidyltransferase substrate binding protein (TIGR01987 family)